VLEALNRGTGGFAGYNRAGQNRALMGAITDDGPSIAAVQNREGEALWKAPLNGRLSPVHARQSTHILDLKAERTSPTSGAVRLVLPLAIQSWSRTSLQQRLFKTGGRLIRHARYFTLQLAEAT